MFSRVHKGGTAAGAGAAGVRAVVAGEGGATPMAQTGGGQGAGDGVAGQASEASTPAVRGAVRVPVAMYETTRQAEERRGQERAAAAAAGGVRQPAVATVGTGIWPDEDEEIPHVVHDYVMVRQSFATLLSPPHGCPQQPPHLSYSSPSHPHHVPTTSPCLQGWKITTPKHKSEMLELLHSATSAMAGGPQDPYRTARQQERYLQQRRRSSPPPPVRPPPGSSGVEYAEAGADGPWAIDAPESFAEGGSWYEVDWENLERERMRDGRPTAVEAEKLRKEKQRRAGRQLKAEQRAVSRGAIRMGKSFKWLGSRDHNTQVKRVDEALKMRVEALNNPNGSTKVRGPMCRGRPPTADRRPPTADR